MGKFIYNHWARLIILTAAGVQVGGSIEGFFWPKITWDFMTTSLDVIVKPAPVLQVINLLLGIVVLAWEWPLLFLTNNRVHRSIHVRLVCYTICAFMSITLYSSHNAMLYYLVGLYGYGLALRDSEIIHPEPWTIPAEEAPISIPSNIDPEHGLKHFFKHLSAGEAYQSPPSTASSIVSSPPKILEAGSVPSSNRNLKLPIFGKYARMPKFQTPINEEPPREWPRVPVDEDDEMEEVELEPTVGKGVGAFRIVKRSRSNTWHHQ